MDLLQRYQTDPVAEAKGVWHKLPDIDVELKVARHGNDTFMARQRELMEPYLDRIRSGEKLTDEEGRAIDDQLFAEHILVGWRIASTKEEVLILGDKRVPWSPEACLGLTQLEGMADFKETVIRLAIKQENYRQSALGQSEKNLPAPLSDNLGATKRKSNGSGKSSSKRGTLQSTSPTSANLSS